MARGFLELGLSVSTSILINYIKIMLRLTQNYNLNRYSFSSIYAVHFLVFKNIYM